MVGCCKRESANHRTQLDTTQEHGGGADRRDTIGTFRRQDSAKEGKEGLMIKESDLYDVPPFDYQYLKLTMSTGLLSQELTDEDRETLHWLSLLDGDTVHDLCRTLERISGLSGVVA